MATNALTDRAFNELQAMLRWWRGFTLLGNRRPVVVGDPDAVPFYNGIPGETIPAYGVMSVIGTVEKDGLKYLDVDKPSTTFRRIYAVNGATDVAYQQTGGCYLSGTRKVLYDAGTPAAGEGWGPKAGQFSLTANYPRVANVMGIDDSTSKILRADIGPIDILIGKLAGALAQGSTATFNVWGGASGSETVITSVTVTVRDKFMATGAADLASGLWGLAQFVNNTWILSQVQCS